MKQNNSLIYKIITFVLCVCIGFALTHFILPKSEVKYELTLAEEPMFDSAKQTYRFSVSVNPEMPKNGLFKLVARQTNTVAEANTTGKFDNIQPTETGYTVNLVNDKETILASIDIENCKTVKYEIALQESPSYDETEKTFNFTVKANPSLPENAHFEMSTLNTNEVISKNSDGIFKSISPSNDGYKITLSSESGVILAETDIKNVSKPTPNNNTPRMSFAEITQAINNLKDGTGGKRYGLTGVAFKYTNLNPDEEAQTTVSNIRQYISLRIWKSVTCISAQYNDNNKVTQVTLQINR